MNGVKLEGDDGTPLAVPLSERVHWVGAFDPNLRIFDIILKPPTAPVTTPTSSAAAKASR